MRRFLFRRAFAVVGVALGLSFVVATPSPAQAANLCGSGYVLVEEYPRYNDISDTLQMYVDLYYSSRAHRNCLVAAHAGETYGEYAPTLAQIWPAGYGEPACNSVGCDKGNYAYYAGPVYTPSGVDMSHRCVNINAEVGYNTHLERRNVHCG
jgi:hypothetical protein